MAGYAHIYMIGNLGRRPDMRSTAEGKAVASFSVAVNDRDAVSFFDVTVFGKTADLCQQYLDKGSLVMVAGNPRIEKYTGRDGSEKSALKIYANTVQFLDRRPSSDPPQKSDWPPPKQSGEGSAENFFKCVGTGTKHPAPDQDDIPF